MLAAARRSALGVVVGLLLTLGTPAAASPGPGTESPADPAGPLGPGVSSAPAAGGQVTRINTRWERRIRVLTNKRRAARGLPALKANKCAQSHAIGWARTMAKTGNFSHQDLGSLLDCPNVWVAAENIAVGFSSPKEVVNAWMASPGHRKIILDKRMTNLGTSGFFGKDGAIYWTQNFVGR